MTFAIFHDFQGLENGLPKFHDFPWPGGTLSVKKTLATTAKTADLSCSTADWQSLLCRNSYLPKQKVHHQSLDTEIILHMMADPGKAHKRKHFNNYASQLVALTWS